MDLFRERRARRNGEQAKKPYRSSGACGRKSRNHRSISRVLSTGQTVTATPHGVHRVQPDIERGDDAEVPATAAQRPEQVRVLGLAGGDEAAVGEHDVRGQQIVHRQAVLAGQVAVAAAEGEASDARCRHDAGGGGEAESVRCDVHFAPCRAALDAGGARVGVHLDAVHPRQVNDDTVLDGSEARTAVAASADRKGEV